MTTLNTFDQSHFPDLEDDCVEAVTACIVYYVTTGRNAWHSTWIQRYAPNCMHSNIESAKRYAEARRTQGTVFTIKQIPAVHIRTERNVSIVVTQINTQMPLSQYAPEATKLQPSPGKKLVKNACDNYLVEGANALGAALSFDCDSRFWKVAPPLKHSVIVLSSKESEFYLQLLGTQKLQTWTSYSNGGDYLLGWSVRGNDVSSASVVALAKG